MSIPYRPLDTAKGEFRLLEIQPARNINEPIECRLVTMRMTDKNRPEYVVLSSLYSDDTPDMDKIWVNGRSVSITNHLSQGLKHARAVLFPNVSQHYQRQPKRKNLRAPRWLRQLFEIQETPRPAKSNHSDSSVGSGLNGLTSLLVWLDYVCVNHADEKEKLGQRAQMKQIYREAELVIGWLGVKGEHSDSGFEVTMRIDDTLPAEWGDPKHRKEHPEDYSPTHAWAVPLRDVWKEGPHWIGAHDMLNRPYLHRDWILEELSMARHPVFLLGDSILPWKRLLRLHLLTEEFTNYPSNEFPEKMIAALVTMSMETTQKILELFAKREQYEESRLIEGKSRELSTSTISS